jgi:uncharacterized protein DUF1302
VERTGLAAATLCGRTRRRRGLLAVLVVALCAAAFPTRAAELLQADGWDLRWDNTLRYTAAFRLSHYDEAIVADPNADDGDRNFAPGLISNRLDLLSEFDLSRGPFGIEASGAFWYDTVYHQTNSNDSPATFNPFTVPHDRFTHATEILHGEDGDLLNAFAYGSFDAGDMPISFRIGRHTLLWGESLFFANNGIAAGQAPIDAIKAASEPEAKAKEVYLPVTQASLTIQPRLDLSFSFYNQFEWRRDRLPGSGSYFSDADFLDAGGERIIAAPGQYLYRTPDVRPSASGQFGAAMHVTMDDVDYGFYALQFHAKEPQLLIFSFPALQPPDSLGVYWLTFPSYIQSYGASFSTYAGESTLAGEVSLRRNMPLVSATLFSLPGGGGGGYGGGAAYAAPRVPESPPLQPNTSVLDYAAGNTLHAQLSSVSTLSPNSFWQGADLSAEIAMNDRLNVTRSPALLASGRDSFAAAFRGVFEPHYYEVLPALDLSVPIGFGYDLFGKSSVDSSMNAGAGDFELGVSATYRTVWEGSLTFTHFFGPVDRQPFADRDFISLSVQRTF